MRGFIKKIWQGYGERYSLYSGLTTGIFLLQLLHLYWLTTHVVWQRLFAYGFFNPNDFWQIVIIIVDYLEIPAIISVSILYFHSLSQKWNLKDALMLFFINSQWLHIFWISDEFVETVLVGGEPSTFLPYWLAWAAIAIDYLELPVIYDTTQKFIASLFWKQKEAADFNMQNKKTQRDWEKKLTPEQYRVMREGGTEKAFTGKYRETKDRGIYKCAACGAKLFSSDAKFDSGTGWPSFTEPANSENIELKEDRSHGMARAEVLCKKCGSHLGHVFDDGPTEKGGKRYCINSVCLNLQKEK